MLLKNRILEIWRPGSTVDARNTRFLYADIAWFGVLSGIAGSFLSVFIIRIGGSNLHIGFLAALPALITFFVSIPGGRLVERERKPQSVLIGSALLNRLGYLAIALVPLVFTLYQADAIVWIVALLTIPAAIFNVAFTTMFGRAVKPERRAHVVTVRNIWVGIVCTAVAFIGGKFLDQILFPINYQILFLAGFVTSLVSVYYLARIQPPADSPPITRHVTDAPGGAHDWARMLRDNPLFARFTWVSFIFHWGMFFTQPLYSIYWVRTLNATDGWVGFLNMVGSAITIVCYPLWSRLTIRYGTLLGIFWATLGLAIYPLATMLSPRIEWIVLIQILGGVTSSGYGLTFFNRLLEVSPELQRPSYIAEYNTLINIAAFASPLIATALTSILDVRALLLVGAGLRFLGPLLFWHQRTLAVS